MQKIFTSEKEFSALTEANLKRKKISTLTLLKHTYIM